VVITDKSGGVWAGTHLTVRQAIIGYPLPSLSVRHGFRVEAEPDYSRSPIAIIAETGIAMAPSVFGNGTSDAVK
jgi:hypothetical protein